MPIQKQPYRVTYSIKEIKSIKIFNTKLEALRFVKIMLESSTYITITRVKSVWKDKHQKNIEKKC